MGYATFSFLIILSFHLFVTGHSTANATATATAIATAIATVNFPSSTATSTATTTATTTATATENSSLNLQTYNTTKYYNICSSSLQSNFRSPNADTKELAIIMVGIEGANTTATSAYLSSQYLSTTDAVKKKVQKECADALSASVQDLSDESYDHGYV